MSGNCCTPPAPFDDELDLVVNWIWDLSDAPHSIYLRGSAARITATHARWDTDVYLFVENGALPKMEASAIAKASAERFPDLPPLDLSSFERQVFLNPGRFVVQKLALHYDGRLARGAAFIDDVPKPELNSATARAVRESVLPFIIRKLETLATANRANCDPTEMARTMALCAKGIIRTIVIPELAAGNPYIRDPLECLNAIIRRFPPLAADGEIIFSVIAGALVPFPNFAAAGSRILEKTVVM